MSKEHFIIKNEKEKLLDNIIKEMLNVLNNNIDKHDLTFEDSLTIAERVRLHLLAKYIDFRLMRMIELTSRLYKGDKIDKE